MFPAGRPQEDIIVIKVVPNTKITNTTQVEIPFDAQNINYIQYNNCPSLE